jgi:hypothetical protein
MPLYYSKIQLQEVLASSQNKCKKTKNYNKEGTTNEHLRQKEKV